MPISSDAKDVRLKEVDEEKDTTIDKKKRCKCKVMLKRLKLKDVAEEKDTSITG